MRMDGEADVRRVGTHLDREPHLRDELAGIGADDARAYHAMRALVEQQLGESLVAIEGERAAARGPGKCTLAELEPAGFRLRLGDSDPRDLRVGVGNGRDRARIEGRLVSG